MIMFMNIWFTPHQFYVWVWKSTGWMMTQRMPCSSNINLQRHAFTTEQSKLIESRGCLLQLSRKLELTEVITMRSICQQSDVWVWKSMGWRMTQRMPYSSKINLQKHILKTTEQSKLIESKGCLLQLSRKLDLTTIVITMQSICQQNV